MNCGSGAFISLEGGDGTGKTTQATLLTSHLESLGLSVHRTREPGGTPLAERLRTLILSGALAGAGEAAETLIFAAARADHVQRVIAPALAAGTWVVSERFFDSTRVYQGLMGVADTLIDELEDEAAGSCRPDLTIVLDLDDALAAERIARRRGAETADRFEGQEQDYHRRVFGSYRRIALADPGRCVLVDASGDADTVAKRVRETVLERLAIHRVPAVVPR